jgi:hypothetical protein
MTTGTEANSAPAMSGPRPDTAPDQLGDGEECAPRGVGCDAAGGGTKGSTGYDLAYLA